MLTARSSATSAVYGEDIYLIGGYTGDVYSWTNGSTLNTVEAYNLKTNTWTKKASMPEAGGALTSVSYQNKIYVFGGLNNNIRSMKTVQVYDPAANSWLLKKPMPYAINSSSAVVHNDKIYLVAGRHIDNNSNVSINTFWEYDPEQDTWTTQPNLLDTRGGGQAVSYDNKIFAIGGKNEAGSASKELKTVESFDFQTNTWSYEPSLNIARGSFAALTYNRKIYVIGGSQSTTSNIPVKEIEIFESTLPPDPKPQDPSEPTANRAILVVTLITGLEKEFDLSMNEVNSFIAWYELRQTGTGQASFAINKHENNKGPFISRKDYILYDKILTFEISEYN